MNNSIHTITQVQVTQGNRHTTTTQLRDGLRNVRVNEASRAKLPRGHYTNIPNIPPPPPNTAHAVLQYQQVLAMLQLYTSRSSTAAKQSGNPILVAFSPGVIQNALQNNSASPYIGQAFNSTINPHRISVVPMQPRWAEQAHSGRHTGTASRLSPRHGVPTMTLETLFKLPADVRRRVVRALAKQVRRHHRRHLSGWQFRKGIDGKWMLQDYKGKTASLEAIATESQRRTIFSLPLPVVVGPALQGHPPTPSRQVSRSKPAAPRARKDIRKLAIKNSWRSTQSGSREIEKRESRLRYTLHAADIVQDAEPSNSPDQSSSLGIVKDSEDDLILSKMFGNVQLGEGQSTAADIIRGQSENAPGNESEPSAASPVIVPNEVCTEDVAMDASEPPAQLESASVLTMRFAEVAADLFPEEERSAIMQAPITVASPGGLVNEPDGEEFPERG